jgi:hypothetical protein
MWSWDAASKRKVKELRWRVVQQPGKTLRTLLLSTHFDREISDEKSAENIDGGVMKEENLKTGISDITAILENKFLAHQTEAGGDFTPAETTKSHSVCHESRTSRRARARSLINSGFKRKARIPMALAFSEVIL